MHRIIKVSMLALLIFTLTGCYSVFSGGTGGLVVDAESTSTPKEGIAHVDVYAYTSEDTRDTDYSSWTEGTIFSPNADYYGHTTTGNDGRFAISRLVWTSTFSDFGKDADYTTVYLLFYHENYGLTKGSTVIISDSTTDTVYAELTRVRKTTALNITLKDVASDAATSEPMYVRVTVPQTTATNTTAAATVYKATITGTGIINVSYPRWRSAADKTAGIENEPTVSIAYAQSSDEVTWLGCYNGDNTDGNYAFRADSAGVTTVTKVIRNQTYAVNLYGKRTKLNMPSFSGAYVNGSGDGLDGKVVTLKRRDSSGSFTIDCGEVTTGPQVIGTSGTQAHGVFSGLGANAFWFDDSYTDKYAVTDVKFYNGSSALTSSVTSVRSDIPSYEVVLN